MSDYQPQGRAPGPSRKTRRLTFRSSAGQVALVSQESLEMICPPSVGDQPEAGLNGGFWVELRDADDQVRFFRVLHDPIRSSVEVHSPDGKIRREFGPATETVFEVLVPDDPEATSLVLLGDYQDPRTAETRRAAAPSGAREMARFDLAGGTAGGAA